MSRLKKQKYNAQTAVDPRKRTKGDVVSRIYLGLVFLFLYAPILILIIYSFNESKFRTWSGFSLQWYIRLFHDRKIMAALLNTLVVAVVSSALSTVLGTLASIGIFSMRKWPRRAVMNITYLPVLNPDIIMGVSLMLLFVFLGIEKGRLTLILAHMSFSIPFVILAVMPKLKQMTPNVYHAALDLGATPMRAMWTVVLPEIMPGVITGLLMAFTLSIDDFMVSFFTTGSGIETLSILIYNAAKKGVSPSINALSALMFVAVLGLLLLINKRAKNSLNVMF